MKSKRHTFVSLFITLIAFFAIAVRTHSQEVEKGWQTWAKVSPCVDHRSEWIVMASKDPNPQGQSHYVPAQQMLFDPAFNICNKQHPFGCTYDEAKAEALNIQASPKFFNYCCKDWNVWKNIDTGQFELVKGPGNPGRSVHQRGGMCCEEAQTWAGITGRCDVGAAGHSLGPDRDGWGFNNQTATILRFFGSNSAASCRSECEKDSQCMAYSWIRPNGYVAGDPPMCYLMSSWSGGVQHPCCISAVKNSPTHGGDFEAFGRPTGNQDERKEPGAQRWILESVTVTPEDPAKVWSRPQEMKWEYSKDSTSAMFTLYGTDTASFQWSPPPQQVDSSGFTISFSVQSPKGSQSMNVWAEGLLQGEAAGIKTDPNSTSQQKTANFKPSPNADGFEVKISVGWGSVTYTYKYRRA